MHLPKLVEQHVVSYQAVHQPHPQKQTTLTAFNGKMTTLNSVINGNQKFLELPVTLDLQPIHIQRQEPDAGNILRFRHHLSRRTPDFHPVSIEHKIDNIPDELF